MREKKNYKIGARENYAQLRGQVVASQSNGLISQAIIKTARPDREIGDRKTTTDFTEISIISKNPEQVAIMQSWKENDIVNVTGTLNEIKTKKIGFCKMCGKALFSFDSDAVSRRRPCINPATIEKITNFSTDKECVDYLLSSNVQPLSNQFWCAGQLKDAPKITSNSEYFLAVSFPLIVPRSRYITEDSPEITYDILRINCYGANAESALKYLVKGSEVDVFGLLRNYNFSEELKCKECGEPNQIKQITAYVDTVRIDFRANCKKDEILEREKKKLEEFEKKFLKEDNYVINSD